MQNRFPIHVRTVTGLEPLLANELKGLTATHIEIKKRVVTCVGDLRLLYAANLWCRNAIRVLRPIASFPAPDEKHFYEGVKAIDWSRWMKAEGTLAVDANVHSSFTTHSLFIAQLTKDAVVDQFREKHSVRPSVELKNPDLRIVLSLYRNVGQVFADASGESLHRRGYRKEAGEAPLNETLAAGIIQHSEWDPKTPFFDPMCGSGTFLIEAGLIARNFAPGLMRERFGFQSWGDYDAALFNSLVEEARKVIVNEPLAPIVGTDLDPKMVAISKENIRRAGLENFVTVSVGDFFTSSVAAGLTPGTLVMNPPYDERLPLENVAAFHQQIGDRLSQRFFGWNANILSGNPDAIRCIGLKSETPIALFNGSIECLLLRYHLNDQAAIEKRQAWRERKADDNPQWKEKAETLANRIKKNFKHLSKWTKREGIAAFRVYDRDIPELAFVIDLFDGRLHFAEVPRNHLHTPLEHAQYLDFMVRSASEALEIAPDKVYFKVRSLKKEETAEPTREYLKVREGDLEFYVNLTDFVDVGLYLDQRKLRSLVRKEAAGRSVLNLYGYTGSLTVYAVAGGARKTTTVDSSSSYLDWAFENLKLNRMINENQRLIRSDVMEFLSTSNEKFDLIVVDPPNRSMNRATGQPFDLQKDVGALFKALVARLSPQGTILMTSHYRTLDLKQTLSSQFPQMKFEEITHAITSPDFEKRLGYRCWRIT